MQVVWACPHIREDQGPEVNDGQTVRVDRTARLFGNEVVHHAQKARCQEESYRVVAIPPLHHRILHPCVSRVAFGQADRHRCTVDNVQQGDCNDERTIKPIAHINVANFTNADCAKKHHGIRHPHHSNQQINGPLQLGVFFAGSETQRQRDGGQHNHQLPTPKGQGRQPV